MKKDFVIVSEPMNIEEETAYTLKHSMKDIRRAEGEIAKGNYVTLEEFEKDLEKRMKKQDAS